MAQTGQENFIPSVQDIPSPAPRPTENFIPLAEDEPVQPPTVPQYFTPEEAQRRFAQYLPIESTPNDILLPSDDPRVYTYQMPNGNIYYLPAFEEQLQERRTIGEAFDHLVDSFPSRTEVEEGLLNLPQATYGAIRNMVTGQGTYEDVIGTATGMVGTKAIPRSRYTDEIVGDRVDEDLIDADFEPIEDNIFEQQPFVPDDTRMVGQEGDWDAPEDLDNPEVPLYGDGIRPNDPLTGDWRIPPAPLVEGKKMPTVPMYPPRDYSPNGYTPQDTIVFRSPVREFVAGMQIPSQGIKGSQFLKMLQDNPSIRNSEVSYLNLGISPEARYTREELQQLVDSRVPQVEAYFDTRYTGYQRQPVRDVESDYKEIVISATPQDPSGQFTANYQHYDNNALAHTRVSVRSPEGGTFSDQYLLVEEMQSDLIQKGWREPTVERTFAEYLETDLQDYVVYMDYPEVGSVVRQVYNSLKPEEWIDMAETANWSLAPFMDQTIKVLDEIDMPESIPYNSDVVRGISAVVSDYATKEAFRVVSAPPIRSTQESTRLLLESIISYADQMDVNEIVFPPLERIAAQRFQVGGKDYQKALTPGSGFHQTYVTALKKAIQELQNEFGAEAVPVYRKELPYGSGNTPSIDFEDARYDWNDLQLMRSRYRQYAPEATPEEIDQMVAQNLERNLALNADEGTMLDEYISRYGNNFMFAQSLDEFYEGNARMTDSLLPTEGVAIYIGGIRNTHNLQYPRFAEGGLVTQTKSAFGEIA